MAVKRTIEPALDDHDAVLFDLDGTLLFLPVDMDSLRERLERFHRRYGLDLNFRPLTDDLARASRLLEQRLGAAEARAAERWARAQVDQAEEEAAERVRPRPGVVAAMQQLMSRGARVGVVSNNTRRGILAALRRIGIAPDELNTVISRQDVSRPKPAPEMVELAVRRLLADGWSPGNGRGRPGRLVFVGDAPSDVMAVRAVDLVRLDPALESATVLIVGGGLAGRGSLAGPDVDLLAHDDQEAFRILTGAGPVG